MAVLAPGHFDLGCVSLLPGQSLVLLISSCSSQSTLGTIKASPFLARREQERLPGAIFHSLPTQCG